MSEKYRSRPTAGPGAVHTMHWKTATFRDSMHSPTQSPLLVGARILSSKRRIRGVDRAAHHVPGESELHPD
jgi:hypothetical protein